MPKARRRPSPPQRLSSPSGRAERVAPNPTVLAERAAALGSTGLWHGLAEDPLIGLHATGALSDDGRALGEAMRRWRSVSGLPSAKPASCALWRAPAGFDGEDGDEAARERRSAWARLQDAWTAVPARARRHVWRLLFEQRWLSGPDRAVACAGLEAAAQRLTPKSVRA